MYSEIICNSIMQQNQVGQDFAAFPLGSVLCRPGLLYKIPTAGWLKQQKFFTDLEAGKANIKLLVGLGSEESCPLGLQTDTFSLLSSDDLSLVPMYVQVWGRQRTRVSFLVLLDTNLLDWGAPIMTSYNLYYFL